MAFSATLQNAISNAPQDAQDELQQKASEQGVAVADLDPSTIQGILSKHGSGQPAAAPTPGSAADLYNRDFGKPKTETKADYPSANAATPGQLDTLASKIKARNAAETPAADALPKTQMPYAPGVNPDEAAAKTAAYQPATSQPTSGGPKGPKPPGSVADAVKAAKPAQRPEAPTPDDATQRLQSLADRAGDRSEYRQEVSKLDGLAQAYQQAYQSTQDKLQLQELGEKMGHALAQLGAGIQGQRTGYDTVTGLKFDKTDWKSRYESALGQLRSQLEDLRAQRGEAARLQEGRETQGAEAARELGRESTQKADTAAREAGELQRERERSAAEQKRTETLVGGRTDVAGINAASREKATNIKASATLGVAAQRAAGKVPKDDPGLQSLNGLQDVAADIERNGLNKQNQARWEAAAGKARTFLQKTGQDDSVIDTAFKQAQDTGLLGSANAGDAAKTLRGGTHAAGQAPAQPSAQSKTVSPQQLQAYMKKYGLSEKDARDHLTQSGFTVQ